MSDCADPHLVQGEADGCDVRCPASAPIPLRECALSCRADGSDSVSCGPGLYCTLYNYTYASYTEACADDSSCACASVPDSCPPPGPDDWVCGIDGHAYPSLCEAHRARTDMLAWDDQAVCPPPSGDFYQCGGIFCRTDEPCVKTPGLDDHAPMSYSCSPIGGAGGEGGGG